MLDHERIDLEAGMRVLPPATITLMLACLAVYFRQVWIGGLDNEGRVIATGAMHRPELVRGELWRLVSGAFMHANAEHLISNMLMLFVLGMACEHAFGLGPFLFLYVMACIVGSLAVTVSATPTVGASGAIFGLAGEIYCGTIYRSSKADQSCATIVLGSSWQSGQLTRWVSALLDPIVSNSCHMGGLAGGLALGAILPAALLSDRAELAARDMTRVQTCLAIVVLLGSAVFFLPHLN